MNGEQNTMAVGKALWKRAIDLIIIRNNKPYEGTECPSEKVQVDVKDVPSECVVNCKKYYQCTAGNG